MKTILVILSLLVANCYASDLLPSRRPAVTQKEIPQYIVAAVADTLKNPSAIEVVSWTVPEFKTVLAAGRQLGRWEMDVTIRSTNSYGGVVPQKFSVVIKNEQVTKVYPYPY